MDLTYLIVVAVFGTVCVVRPCSPLPVAAAAAAAAAAVAPTPIPSEPTLQVAAAEPANNGGKRSRSLFQSPPTSHQYRLRPDGMDAYDDVMDDLPAVYMQRQQQRPQTLLDPMMDPAIDEDELRTADDDVEQDLRLSSRARPGGKPAADSPVYYIRLPPQPYMYVPGYGYVSQPTRLEPPPFTQRPHSPFLNLPLDFVANGKPVGIYTLPQEHNHGQQQYQRPQYQQQQPQYQHQQPQYQHQQPQYQHQQPQYQQQQQQQQLFPGKPKPNRRPQPPPTATPPPPPQQPEQQPELPDSPIYNLDKGPYVFNGRPTDVFLLQSAYDNLYSEVLQNIYP